ncbi:MAG: tetratricopeptide repeat protein [Dokdonella sp.]
MPTTEDLLRAALSCHRAGDLVTADKYYRELLAQDLGNVDALHMLGMLQHQRGQSAQALQWLDKALALAADKSSILANRAAIHLALADPAASEIDARQAIAGDPGGFGGWINLGLALAAAGREAEAARALRQASVLRPQHAGALLQWFRCAAISAQGAGIAARLRKPLPPLAAERSLALEVATLLEHAGRANAALALLARLRTDLPGDTVLAARFDIEMHYRRACELESQRCSGDAIAMAAQVLARSPQHRGARLLRAELFRERGEIEAALAEYATLRADHPRDAIAASSQLIALQHAPQVSANALAAAHRRWAADFASASPRWVPAQPHADPERPLRIGWLSPRFSAGVVETFFAAEFAALDRHGMQHFLYDNGSIEDDANARFRAAAAVWRQVDELDDAQLCELIRADRIDVLVELSGHGPANRLRALAARPAPVQISWLDYFHSSGLDAIDFMLSDERLSPPQFARHYSERLLYLSDGRLCHAPAFVYPQVRPRVDAGLRFACFNRLAKINDAVLAAWSHILQANPSAVLRLKAGAFDDVQTRSRFLARCAACGIDAARLELAGYGTHEETLAAYADVDIALDPFPFSGCATSCDALAMGVPVVAWCGDTMASRQSMSLLVALGLSDCVAVDAGDYVERVQALVDNPDRRAILRATLPARARNAAVEVGRHATQVSAALRQAWKLWCAGALHEDGGSAPEPGDMH